MKLRDALLTMSPSLTLQRAAADEIARQDALLAKLKAAITLAKDSRTDKALGLALHQIYSVELP